MEEHIMENTEEIKPNFFRTKKGLITIIALAVLLIAAIVIGGSFILPKDISGAWELVVNPEMPVSTADETLDSDKAYYVFDKPDRYGRGEYHTSYQGGVEYYDYALLIEDSVSKINLGTENLEYKITGSKLLGNAKFTIIFPGYTDETTGYVYEAEEYVFIQAKDPEYQLQSYDVYQTDDSLLNNKWSNNQRTLSYFYYLFSYVQTVEFSDNGVMTIHYESEDLGLDRYMYYAYTTKDSKLTFSLVTDKETTYTVAYEFDENGNLKFTDDVTSASIFADAFFGEFTFYTEENLPEPTEASFDEMYFSE